jgi:hypothetical protein
MIHTFTLLKLSLPLPNEDFGRPNEPFSESFSVRFEALFKGSTELGLRSVRARDAICWSHDDSMPICRSNSHGHTVNP